MRKTIYNMDDLNDSKEFFNLKPSRIISIFTVFVMTALVVIFMWFYFGNIDEYFKAFGVLKPQENVIVVKNVVAGKLNDKTFFAGKQVNKGDLLFSIEKRNIEHEKQKINVEQEFYKIEKENLLKLKQSIVDGKNYFDKNNAGDEIFYNRFLQYMTTLKIKNSEIERIDLQISELNKDKTELIILKQSVESETNLIKDRNSLKYLQYKDFEFNLNKMRSLLQEKEKAYVSEVKENSESNDVKILKKDIEDINLEIGRVKNEYLLKVQAQIEETNKQINSLESMTKVGGADTIDKHNLENYKIDYLIKLEESINYVEKSIEENNNILEKLGLEEENYYVTAPTNGYIDVINDVNVGDLIGGGEEVLKIVPESKNFKLQVFITNENIVHVKKGQKVTVSFLGISNDVYKNIEGEIVYISKDTMVHDGNGRSYYNAEVKIGFNSIEDKNRVIDLNYGMQSEVKIITGSKNLLKYVIDKIGFFN